MSDAVLRVSNLSVAFGETNVLDHISFEVPGDGSVAIAGEPGAGKSVCALSILRLTRVIGTMIEGRIEFAGRDILTAPEPTLQDIRGEGIGLALPDSLHPCFRLGDQVVEAIRAHHPIGKMAARDRAIDLLEAVGIQRPHAAAERYPAEVTALERRLGALAIALANGPQLLIADDPTGGLDSDDAATVEALLGQLHCAVLLTTRDRALASRFADMMLTLEEGHITERLARIQPEARPEPAPEVQVVRRRSGGLLGRLRRRRN
jgi:ABC-type microcin C transport system duplicated ATPase subunit YejF